MANQTERIPYIPNPWEVYCRHAGYISGPGCSVSGPVEKIVDLLKDLNLLKCNFIPEENNRTPIEQATRLKLGFSKAMEPRVSESLGKLGYLGLPEIIFESWA